MPRSVSTVGHLRFKDIDWQRFDPVEEATLLFVVRERQILLIDKKRGMGAGKINGPGGRIENGESPIAAAIREVEEELQVTPLGTRQCGELCFQFMSGYSLRCHIFKASNIRGVPKATPEATPRWETVGNLPFEKMWDDDQIWLPYLLAGLSFRGAALFEDERLLDHNIRPLELRWATVD